MWETVEAANGVHVRPTYDNHEHVLDGTCSCTPTKERTGQGQNQVLWIHQTKH